MYETFMHESKFFCLVFEPLGVSLYIPLGVFLYMHLIATMQVAFLVDVTSTCCLS